MVRVVLVLAALAAAAVVPAGCGSRCADVARVRADLAARAGATGRGADVEVRVPFARANTLIADLLAQKPLVQPIDSPDLGPIRVDTPLTATVTRVVLQPGPPGRVRLAVRVRIDETAGDAPAEVTTEVTTIDALAELTPEVAPDALTIGLAPQNVISLRPVLGDDATAKLGGAVARWIPGKVASKLPQALVDAAAKKLGEHLTGAAWTVLQKTLLVRLGELTRLRLRLPDVPIGHADVHSEPDALVVAIASTLPVRAGLAAATPASDDVTVRIAGSAAAELANWAYERAYLPQRYARSLSPSKTGEFRPYFDYVPGTSHPLKVYAFQDRGGCSYFKVGVSAKLGMSNGKLAVTATDRDLEAQRANVAIEAAAWVKFFLTGWVDRSKQVAAHTQLTLGGRTLVTDVIGAELAHDELTFALALSAPNGSATSSPSAGSSGGIANSSR